MRASTCSMFCLVIAVACSAPPPVPRAPIVPPLAIDAPVVDYRERARAAADRSSPTAMTAQPADPTVSEPIYRTVVHTVEVEVPAAVQSEIGYYRDRDQGYYAATRDDRRDPPSNPFPVNTAIGAGIGAIIGNQNGNRGEGALIGSGIGLLFDLHRWIP